MFLARAALERLTRQLASPGESLLTPEATERLCGGGNAPEGLPKDRSTKWSKGIGGENAPNPMPRDACGTTGPLGAPRPQVV